MPEVTRHQKITFGEMRASGVRGLLIYCSDYKCSHSTAISADRWPDDVRLSDIEPRFTCQACGQRGRGRPPEFRLGRGSGPTRDDVRTTHVGPDQTVGSHRGMAKSRMTTIRGKNPSGWKRPFEDQIDLPRGRRRLVTLQDAADYILKLPKAQQDLEQWQTATEALIMAAEGRGPLMHARIGVMKALKR